MGNETPLAKDVLQTFSKSNIGESTCKAGNYFSFRAPPSTRISTITGSIGGKTINLALNKPEKLPNSLPGSQKGSISVTIGKQVIELIEDLSKYQVSKPEDVKVIVGAGDLFNKYLDIQQQKQFLLLPAAGGTIQEIQENARSDMEEYQRLVGWEQEVLAQLESMDGLAKFSVIAIELPDYTGRLGDIGVLLKEDIQEIGDALLEIVFPELTKDFDEFNWHEELSIGGTGTPGLIYAAVDELWFNRAEWKKIGWESVSVVEGADGKGTLRITTTSINTFEDFKKILNASIEAKMLSLTNTKGKVYSNSQSKARYEKLKEKRLKLSAYRAAQTARYATDNAKALEAGRLASAKVTTVLNPVEALKAGLKGTFITGIVIGGMNWVEFCVKDAPDKTWRSLLGGTVYDVVSGIIGGMIAAALLALAAALATGVILSAGVVVAIGIVVAFAVGVFIDFIDKKYELGMRGKVEKFFEETIPSEEDFYEPVNELYDWLSPKY